MKTFYGLLFTSCAHLSKLIAGFILIKLIAFYLGPEGLGELGHFMSVAAILFMLAGGGISNGVIKYVAEYKNSPRKLASFISASATYASIFSLFILILGIAFSTSISKLILNNPNFYWVIILLALSQIGFSLSIIVSGVANGVQDTKLYAKIQIIGVILGLPIIYCLNRYGGYIGSALSIIVLYFSNFIPAFFTFKKSAFFNRILNLKNLKAHYRKLLPFTLMLFTTTLAFPLVEILIREFLIQSSSYSQAGLWQGCIKLSSAYIGFFAVFLGAYYMPIIASEMDMGKINRHVFNFLLITASVFLLGATTLYLFREFFITLFLSENFIPLKEYILYQLIGDFFKVCAYVFGYVAVAKAATKIYIGAELFQSFTFFGISIFLSTITQPLFGVFLGYTVTYVLYFLVSLIFFLIWSSKKTKQF